MRNRTAFALVAALSVTMLTGCVEVLRTSTITGRVTDSNGRPARDVVVRTRDAETRSSSSGAFVLNGNREGDIIVTAEVTRDGLTYRGRTVARTISGQSSLSANIVIAPVTQLARISGSVRDRNGRFLQGVRVFAFAPGYLSSTSAVSGSDGRYELVDLIAGTTYTVQAGGPGYENDTDTLSLTAGENRTFNFVLDDRGTPVLPQVTNLGARAWTSHVPAGRNVNSQAWEAVENIRQRWDGPRTRPATSRNTLVAGNPVEVELFWDRLQGPDFYGYGIYRGIGTASIIDYDFYREPLAGTYIDGDASLLRNAVYRYQVTALGTGFPDAPGSEGPRSAIVEARTLGILNANANSVAPATLQFTWNSNTGANSFVVYLFEEFPRIGVTSIFNNESSPISGNTFVYNRTTNPAGLVQGRTYFYLVLGLANSNSSRTLSQVGTFIY